MCAHLTVTRVGFCSLATWLALACTPQASGGPVYVAGTYTPTAGGHAGFLQNLASGQFISITVPGSLDTFTHGINNLLQTSGYYDDAAGAHGYVRSPGGAFTTFDAPGAVSTYAYGINDPGQVAGSFNDASNNAHGFVRDAGGNFLVFDVPGSVATAPSGINDAGAVVGSDGTYSPTTGLVDHGFVRNPNGTFNTFDVPGASNTFASGINSQGDIVGTFNMLSNGILMNHGFILSGGQYITFDVPNGLIANDPNVISTSAFGIDDAGDIYGTFKTADGLNHAYIRSPTGLYTILNIPGSVSASAKGGSSPEPTSVVMTATGLLCLAAFARKRAA